MSDPSVVQSAAAVGDAGGGQAGETKGILKKSQSQSAVVDQSAVDSQTEALLFKTRVDVTRTSYNLRRYASVPDLRYTIKSYSSIPYGYHNLNETNDYFQYRQRYRDIWVHGFSYPSYYPSYATGLRYSSAWSSPYYHDRTQFTRRYYDWSAISAPFYSGGSAYFYRTPTYLPRYSYAAGYLWY